MSQNIIVLSTAEQLAAATPKKEQQAVTTFPQQIQTKQSRNPSSDMTDYTLLFEIFKFAAWGLERVHCLSLCCKLSA